MNAWRNELGGLAVRSLALPRDGGVLNPRTAGKYRLDSTNVAKTIKRETARLKAEAQAAATSMPAPALPCVLALATAVRAKA